MARSPASQPDQGALPRLPRHFYRRSPLASILFISWVLALWWGPALAAHQLMSRRDLPLVVCLAGAGVLWFVAGQGVHLLGFVGHDGFHFNLFRSRWWSASVGIVLSSMTVVFLQAGVAIDHLNHHRHTNREDDPDLRLFGKLERWWTRLLFARSRANRAFFVDLWRLLLNLPLEMDERSLPFPRPTYRRFAALNLACACFWLSSYVWLGMQSFSALLCFVVLPFSFASLYSGIRPYLEHDDTDAETNTCARSRTHWLLTLFYCGNNLHLEHHLYPSIPCYRLPQVHRWLVSEGHLPRDHSHFDGHLWSSYRYVSSALRYGKRALP